MIAAARRPPRQGGSLGLDEIARKTQFFRQFHPQIEPRDRLAGAHMEDAAGAGEAEKFQNEIRQRMGVNRVAVFEIGERNGLPGTKLFRQLIQHGIRTVILRKAHHQGHAENDRRGQRPADQFLSASLGPSVNADRRRNVAFTVAMPGAIEDRR